MIDKKEYFDQYHQKEKALVDAQELLPQKESFLGYEALEPHYSKEIRDLARHLAKIASEIASHPELSPILLQQLANKIEPYNGNNAVLRILPFFYLDKETGILFFPSVFPNQITEN